jgi:regulatory protein
MSIDLESEIQKERDIQNNMTLDKLADYLSRREHTETELRQKLIKRFPPSAVDWALAEANERQWLSDPEELADRVARSLHRRKKGSLYISRYLRNKGLPQVSKNLDHEIEKAQGIAEEKLFKTKGFSYEEKQKLARWLTSRGYDDETIRVVIYEE